MLRSGKFRKPVINLHELTNGIEKYYHPSLKKEVLGKPKGTDWGYFQSLNEIEEFLLSADHFITSRLAHYHIVNRKDTIAEQIKFYEYLNNNFFIISCRRENLFEHVLSWAINAHSKHLNVYSAAQKISVFYDIYKNGITVSKETIDNYLTKYKNYIEWSDNYFNVQSYFNYDTDVHNIENYILNLDFMSGGKTWGNMFGQEFNDWNACHRLIPNLVLENRPTESTINLTNELIADYSDPEENWKKLKGDSWPNSYYDHVLNKTENLPVEITNEIAAQHNNNMSVAVTKKEYQFLETNLPTYQKANLQILNLVKAGLMVTGIPIKLQSLREKKLIIKNYKDCIAWYNAWVTENNFGKLYNEEELDETIKAEELKLSAPINQNLLN